MVTTKNIAMGQNCNDDFGAILKFIDDFDIGAEHGANLQHLVAIDEIHQSR